MVQDGCEMASKLTKLIQNPMPRDGEFFAFHPVKIYLHSIDDLCYLP